MKKLDEVPLIKVQEYLKISVTDRKENSNIGSTKIAVNKRV